jgi:hypothetical protein
VGGDSGQWRQQAFIDFATKLQIVIDGEIIGRGPEIK